MTINKTELHPLAEVRRHLHTIPEVAMNEHQTAHFVVSHLKKRHPHLLLEQLGGTGIAAVWKGQGAGPVVMLRSELDALPIREINDFDHRSTIEGVSHKCGHDGHSTILLGVADWLEQHPPARGSVVLLFQPGEETGEGAPAVIADKRFGTLNPTHVFALHNLPGYESGTVVLKEGGFTAAVKSLIIKFHGKTSHAAEPENGINPALAIAEVLQLERTLGKPAVENPEFFLITPVFTSMGDKAYGISAGYGEVHLTIRSWSEAVMKRESATLIEAVQRIAATYKLDLETEWTHVFQSNVNHPDCLAVVESAAHHCDIPIVRRQYPFKWGEDFGCFTQQYPGVMFGLGAGTDCAALHNPDYDFPDELLDPGIRMMTSILRQLTS